MRNSKEKVTVKSVFVLFLGFIITAIIMTQTALFGNERSLSRDNDRAAMIQEVGLLAYWKFDEGIGSTTSDSSGNGHHGTISGATWSIGKIGPALLFNGLRDHVLFPVNMWTNSDFVSGTIHAWLKPDPTIINTRHYVVDIEGFIGLFMDNSGAMSARIDAGGGDVTSNSLINDGEWHHVAFTWENNGMIEKIYIDGELNGMGSGGPTNINVNNNSSTVGSERITGFPPHDVAINCFRGVIDEVKIYNRALTESEIWDIYNEQSCTYGPLDQPLTFTRSKGKPVPETVEWDSCGGIGTMEISVYNVSSARIKLNEQLVLGPDCFSNCFKQNINRIILNIELLEGNNVLEVELHGKPGSKINLEFNRDN